MTSATSAASTDPSAFCHEFPFDPTYGYDLDALLQVPAPEEPADFASFWREMYAAALTVAPEPTLRASGAAGNKDTEVFAIEFNSLGGRRIGGWLTRPRRGPITRGVVVGHGYGGREQPDLQLPISNAAAIFPVARGMPTRSRFPDIPDQAAGHVIHGIASRDTYSHGGSAADLLWCAASALVATVPESGRRLDYMGGSFGGGIGALALPWDARISAAHLGVPSFGNHPLRLTLPCAGSGESVRTYYRDHPDVTDVLRYFDAASAARHISIPVLVAAARFDPAVPPPGQFAVYNALPGLKELFVLSAGHFDYPDAAAEERRLKEALVRFFTVA